MNDYKEKCMKTRYSLDKEEEKMVKKIPQKYLTNRVGGGLRLKADLDFMKFLNSTNQRDFDI